MIQVVADIEKIPNHTIEAVVRFLLRLIATGKKTNRSRFEKTNFLGFLLKVLASSRENQNCFLIVFLFTEIAFLFVFIESVDLQTAHHKETHIAAKQKGDDEKNKF